jgi:hypothetical protein
MDQHNGNRGRAVFTDTEEEEYIRMSRQPDLFETFASSIAPSIFGNKGKPLSNQRYGTLISCSTHRHQKSHYMFAVWWI